MALTAPHGEMGVKPSKEFPKVYGVLMDWPLGEQTATVFSLCDGTASLYTTSTFGIIGGAGHASVRAAAARFVNAAARHYDTGMPTKVYPYSRSGRALFYLLCFDGVRMIEVDESALRTGKDKYSDLWSEGQRVLAELRLTTENTKRRQ
jgi:hypothetical protein